MPDIINLLPDSIANQIAAGEVVQRPASAVKELLENALDAEATSIQLIVKESGKALIQVIDNGIGMTETDARMSLERHATSKIKRTEDLFTLRTMGFRGEALASIAAVSQMEMRTRKAENELGTLIVVEGSDIKRQEPVACEQGTSISVKNLFYNIPARRNFLKSNSVEARHIMDEFHRVALANPEVAFTFTHNESIEFELGGGKLSQRIVSLFGKPYQKQLAPCQEETAVIRVQGYVGRPEAAKKTRGEQFLFVNRRFIKSNYLHHAVMSAFEGLITEGSFPFYVLFIDIDPKHIDVNVHPTKTEIKFDDERTVYGVVLAAVRQAVGSHSLTPAIDFQEDVNIISKLENTPVDKTKDIYFEERFQRHMQRSTLSNWEKLIEGDWLSKFEPPKQVDQRQEIRFESSINKPDSDTTHSLAARWMVQLHERYILRPVKSGMMIIDQREAHYRVLYEKNLDRIRNKKGESQQSLFPQTLEFSAADFALVMEIGQEIAALGFRFEVFGKQAIVVTGIPAHLPAGNEKQLFEELVEQFKINQTELLIPMEDNLSRALASRACIKAGQVLQKEEMQNLVDQLFVCKTPNYSPDGTPTFFIFELGKIQNYFNRP